MLRQQTIDGLSRFIAGYEITGQVDFCLRRYSPLVTVPRPSLHMALGQERLRLSPSSGRKYSSQSLARPSPSYRVPPGLGGLGDADIEPEDGSFVIFTLPTVPNPVRHTTAAPQSIWGPSPKHCDVESTTRWAFTQEIGSAIIFLFFTFQSPLCAPSCSSLKPHPVCVSTCAT